MAPLDVGSIGIKVLLIVILLFAALKFGEKANLGAASKEIESFIEAATGKKPKELFTPQSLMYLFMGLVVFGIVISIINFFKG